MTYGPKGGSMHDKMYSKSPTIKKDENGKASLSKGSKDTMKADAGTDDIAGKEKGPEHMPLRHAKERMELHHKHKKEIMEKHGHNPEHHLALDNLFHDGEKKRAAIDAENMPPPMQNAPQQGQPGGPGADIAGGGDAGDAGGEE